MGPFKIFDLLGPIDILSGILLFFTVSPVPTDIAQLHAGFLIYKGLGSHIAYIPLPLPVFYIGAFADLMSAAILFVGTPPIFAEYSTYLAGALLLKGIWTSLSAIS
jgi:hypothetical protein